VSKECHDLTGAHGEVDAPERLHIPIGLVNT
jgi:hypothetical protein